MRTCAKKHGDGDNKLHQGQGLACHVRDLMADFTLGNHEETFWNMGLLWGKLTVLPYSWRVPAGFCCQLLQWQKRRQPKSLARVRLYRVAPHCQYAPMQLVRRGHVNLQLTLPTHTCLPAHVRLPGIIPQAYIQSQCIIKQWPMVDGVERQK